MSTSPSLDFNPARVKNIRVRLGLTQQDFADLLKVNPNTVGKWESGGSVPTRGPQLKALLDAERKAEPEAAVA